jgi:hypothetical protein
MAARFGLAVSPANFMRSAERSAFVFAEIIVAAPHRLVQMKLCPITESLPYVIPNAAPAREGSYVSLKPLMP